MTRVFRNPGIAKKGRWGSDPCKYFLGGFYKVYKGINHLILQNLSMLTLFIDCCELHQCSFWRQIHQCTAVCQNQGGGGCDSAYFDISRIPKSPGDETLPPEPE